MEDNYQGYFFGMLLHHNGTAVEGESVTRRSHPAASPGSLAMKLSRWQDRYGAVFAPSRAADFYVGLP